MEKSLEKVNDKIDKCTDAVSNLTEKIPQWVFLLFLLENYYYYYYYYYLRSII